MVLVVIAGRPGTGKTSLARRLSTELTAVHLRIDALESVVVLSGVATSGLGPVGYLLAREVTGTCLRVGVPVVVDAVFPDGAARAGWADLAEEAGTTVRAVEVALADAGEHRRRVEARDSDGVVLAVPTWEQVLARPYEPWDTERDGPRLLVHNDGELADTLARIRSYLAEDA